MAHPLSRSDPPQSEDNLLSYGHMILPIRIEPAAVLRRKAATVKVFDQSLKQLAKDMQTTMHNAIGIGLAAPQVGHGVALIVIEMHDPENDGEQVPFTALVNPRITWHSLKQVVITEACLSIPGFEGDVRRPEKVRVKAQDTEGRKLTLEADGLFARVLQHEIDHLNGILFTDYVPKKKLVERPLVEYPQTNE